MLQKSGTSITEKQGRFPKSYSEKNELVFHRMSEQVCGIQCNFDPSGEKRTITSGNIL